MSDYDFQAAADRYAPVIRRLARDKHLSKRAARTRFVEMLKFLEVCAATRQVVSPPPRIDDAWHAFVLFTRDYAAYCEARFGFFVHHDPSEASEPAAYERARKRATARFGPLDRRVWSRSGTGSWLGGGDGGGGGGCGGGGCGGGGGG